jgi:hypothetical protein
MGGDDIVRRCDSEDWAASTDDGLVCPFGYIDVEMAEVPLDLLER